MFGVAWVLGFSGNMFNPLLVFVCNADIFDFGIVHVNLVNQYFNDPDLSSWFAVLFESLITITCMLIGGYLFYLIFNWVSPLMGTRQWQQLITVFIIPLVFYYSLIQYINIPFDIYKTWQHTSINATLDFDKIEFKTLLLLNLELTKIVEDGKKQELMQKPIKTVYRLAIGFIGLLMTITTNTLTILFNCMIIHKHHTLGFFFTPRNPIFHFRKFIDFDKTMEETELLLKQQLYANA